MKVLCCGDRNWSNEKVIEQALAKLSSAVTIIHGDAPGADSIAGRYAARFGYDVEAYPAAWSKFGKKAGPIRNTQMLLEGKPTVIWAFHNDLAQSKGTLNMVTQARRAGIRVKLFTEEKPEGVTYVVEKQKELFNN
jgi:hypothetical protein